MPRFIGSICKPLSGPKLHAFFSVVDPHVQMILFLAHALAGQGDAHAHQAALLVVAFGVARIRQSAGTATRTAIGLQWRQAEHLMVSTLTSAHGSSTAGGASFSAVVVG